MNTVSKDFDFVINSNINAQEAFANKLLNTVWKRMLQRPSTPGVLTTLHANWHICSHC